MKNKEYDRGFEMGFTEAIARIEKILRDRSEYDTLRQIMNVFNGMNKLIEDREDFPKNKENALC